LRPAGKPVELPPTPIATAPKFYSTKGQLILLIPWEIVEKALFAYSSFDRILIFSNSSLFRKELDILI
jgi:hypothetical protein